MDARKSLHVLNQEWSNCTRCELGTHRMAVNGEMVFGEGEPRAILFVGEGPGKNEERQGRPFVGESGGIFRTVLSQFRFDKFYVTNVVACRSCTPMTTADGSPMFGKSFGKRPPMPLYRDEPPSAVAVSACLPRLLEEIYLVDPVLIVSLGAKAAEALTGKAVAITQERGKERHITIPGASHRASLTEKKGAWIRKIGGKTVAPTEPNEVRYLLLPTLHPAYVLRSLSDKRNNSALRQFASDIRKAVRIYEQYMVEVFGVTVTTNSNATDEQIEETIDNLREREEDEDQYGQG